MGFFPPKNSNIVNLWEMVLRFFVRIWLHSNHNCYIATILIFKAYYYPHSLCSSWYSKRLDIEVIWFHCSTKRPKGDRSTEQFVALSVHQMIVLFSRLLWSRFQLKSFSERPYHKGKQLWLTQILTCVLCATVLAMYFAAILVQCRFITGALDTVRWTL